MLIIAVTERTNELCSVGLLIAIVLYIAAAHVEHTQTHIYIRTKLLEECFVFLSQFEVFDELFKLRCRIVFLRSTVLPEQQTTFQAHSYAEWYNRSQ